MSISDIYPIEFGNIASIDLMALQGYLQLFTEERGWMWRIRSRIGIWDASVDGMEWRVSKEHPAYALLAIYIHELKK